MKPTLILIIALASLPLLIWLEHTEPDLWPARLAFADLGQSEPNLHTPQHAIGTFLPPEIRNDLTLTPKDNPIILTGKTVINESAALTLQPGTTVYAHEFARLEVNGRLAGKATTFTTNELHPQNQIWSGIVVNSSGQITLESTNITYAYPGLTCQPNSQAQVNQSHISQTRLGVFTASENCLITNSRIQSKDQDIIKVN